MVVVAYLTGLFKICVKQLDNYCNKDGKNTCKKNGERVLAGEYCKYPAEYLRDRIVKRFENSEETENNDDENDICNDFRKGAVKALSYEFEQAFSHGKHSKFCISLCIRYITTCISSQFERSKKDRFPIVGLGL